MGKQRDLSKKEREAIEISKVLERDHRMIKAFVGNSQEVRTHKKQKTRHFLQEIWRAFKYQYYLYIVDRSPVENF